VTVSWPELAAAADQEPRLWPVGAPSSLNQIGFAPSPLATMIWRIAGTIAHEPASR
jgi:hypothetical protein